MPVKRRATSNPEDGGGDDDEQGDTASEARLASYIILPSTNHITSQHSQMNSCESCKSRKLKCDRGLPSCIRCQRSGTDCVYHERKRPGFQAGFRQNMEERLGTALTTLL